MNKYIKNFNTILTSLSFAVGIDGYRRTIEANHVNSETDKIIKDTIRKSGELARTLQEQLEHKKFEDVKLEADLGRVKDQLESINQDVEMLNKFSNTEETNPILIETSSETLKKTAKSASELIDKLLSSINDGNNYNIIDFFDNYRIFLDSLTLIQISLFVHIFLSVLILYFLWNILVAYYSNKIITYFNLETKYPRLKKYFDLRIKFQDYYIKLNSFFLVGSILSVSYLDIQYIILTFN